MAQNPYQKMIYLDYAATTPIDPEINQLIYQSMIDTSYENDIWANVSSAHILGKAARNKVNQVKQTIAHLLNCKTEEIIFTSGATESINQALKGVMLLQKTKRHMITSSVEHKATLQVTQSLMKEGVKVSFAKPNVKGLITLEAIQSLVTEQTALVSLIWVNNEIGTINEIEKIALFLREKEILFHVDATQAISRLNIDASQIDLLSFSGHKLHAPKGCGVLIRRSFPKINLKALIEGSSQQGIRGGTLANHHVLAIAKALELTKNNHKKEQENSKQHYELIRDTLLPLDIRINGCQEQTVFSIVNLLIPNVINECLIHLLPTICFSTGSACNSENDVPSHVLTEIGLSAFQARQSIRISFGRFTSKQDIKEALELMIPVIKHLQNIASFRSSIINDSNVNAVLKKNYSKTVLIQSLINPVLIDPQDSDLKIYTQKECIKQTDEYFIKLQLKMEDSSNKYALNASVCGCPYLIALISGMANKCRSKIEQIWEQESNTTLFFKEHLNELSKEICLPIYKIRLLNAVEILFKQLFF